MRAAAGAIAVIGAVTFLVKVAADKIGGHR